MRLERYVKDIEIEVEALKNLVSAHVLPSAYRQHALLASAGPRRAISVALDRLGSQMDDLMARVNDLQAAADRASTEAGLLHRAGVLAEEVVPAMAGVREVCIMYFYKGYGLHGTYWHNNFGLQMSHGCVNMRNEDARWLFRWSTPVFDPYKIESSRDCEKTGHGTTVLVSK